MTIIDPAHEAARESARDKINGRFGAHTHEGPEVALETVSTAELLGYSPTCTEGCGRTSVYRLGDIPNGYRAPDSEGALCEVHAAAAAASGTAIEPFPQPQEPGETLVWLIEGDDHEYVRVEATTEEQALELAAESFEDMYGYDDDERTPIEDLLVVAGAFRGDVDGYSDELEYVPTGGISENTAYSKLNQS